MDKIIYTIDVHETDEYEKFVFADCEWNREFKIHALDSKQQKLKKALMKEDKLHL